MQISDTNGTWVQNMGQYRFHDPESNTVFEPGIPTKAKATDWLKGQSVIKSIADPLAPPPKPVVLSKAVAKV